MATTYERRIGDPERVTQNRVIDLLTSKEMGYDYIGYWKKRENNSNIEKEYVIKFLKKQGYSDELIRKAVNHLEASAKLGMGNSLDDKLYTTNKEFYSILRYGESFKVEGSSVNQRVNYIDWNNISNNDFYIAEEVTYLGCHEKRPDIVIYVNGIAIGVLELKSSIVDVAEGIRQNITNQRSAITQFFTTVQFVMAGNESQGLKYGTTLTKEKYYLSWKEYNYETKESKRLPFFDEIKAFCNKERLMDMMLNFVVFDNGIKKLCRHNQYFGVKSAQKFIQNNEGGIIWHTQGSGKSLSMVWLAKWIKEFYPDGRVLLVTDRIELDEQIEGVFAGVDERIVRTKNGEDLLNRLNYHDDRLICSLVHKFGGYSDKEDADNSKEYIEDLKRSIPSDFNPKGKIIVFVDECHRTQSGKLHKAMKEILPNALFIGFTGTPLLKKDKATSLETFGRYIHCYKFDEAVKDEVVLDLRYEARDIPQRITDQNKIDEWFEFKTRGLNDVAKARLKKMWGNMQTLLSSQSRLDKIALDIIEDFYKIPRLAEGRGNAMLVASSILEACRYWKIFQSKGFKKCAVVTSYSPHHKDVRTEDTGEDSETKLQEQYNTYLEMLGIDSETKNKEKKAEEYENSVKEQFKKEPANMKLLIVVDKLLTGFDAPPATYLYLDKKMKDHGLFQAVCRVNRLDGESKDYGYIVDYMDLFGSLEKSIIDYTSDVLAGFDKEDITGLLNDRKQLARGDFDKAMETIKGLLEGVVGDSDDSYRAFFHCYDDVDSDYAIKKRYQLYKAVNNVVRSYTNFLPYAQDEEVGYSENQVEQFAETVKSYVRLKEMIMLSSGDSIDFKAYEGDMRFMIDNYIEAGTSSKLCDFEGMPLVDLVVEQGEKFVEKLPDSIKNNKKSVAETIENHIRKVVNYEYQTNPEYYEKMSKILDNLIEQRKQDKMSYAEYLKKVSELAKKVRQVGGLDYPASIVKQKKLRALYDNLDKNEALAIELNQSISTQKPHNYKSTEMKRKRVKQIIGQTLHTNDKNEIERIYKIVEQNYD